MQGRFEKAEQKAQDLCTIVNESMKLAGKVLQPPIMAAGQAPQPPIIAAGQALQPPIIAAGQAQQPPIIAAGGPADSLHGPS